MREIDNFQSVSGSFGSAGGEYMRMLQKMGHIETVPSM